MTARSLPRRGSLQFRLPALIVGIVLLVVVAFSLASYRHVRRGLEGLSAARLETAGQRLESMLVRSVAQQTAAAGEMATHPAVAAALAEPAGRSRPVLATLFDSLIEASAAHTGIVLRRGGEVVGARGDTGSAAPLREPGIGPLVRRGDRIEYVVSVPAGSDALLQVVRRIASDSEDGRAIAGLIGRDARFLLGNREADVWTDLGSAVDGPPAVALGGGIASFVGNDGEPHTGLARPVPGTPWLVWVDLPRRVVRDPLGAFIRDMAVTAILLVGLAALLGWLLSRRITRPLVTVTGAAESIAHGDYSRRIGIDRADEIGRLGQSFDIMAEEVEQAHSQLERGVADRTAELEEALRELREAQDELVRKERLALLGELAGGVGHELRNPLGVMNNAVFYLEAVLGDQPEHVRDYLGILRHQVHVCGKIVSDLLDFARVRPPQREPVDIESLAREQVERADVADGIEVRYDFDERLTPANVDRGQIAQVVLNLVFNAAQAMADDGGGTLTLRGRAEDDRVILDVEDTGPGVPPELRAKIFKPLFTTKARGIGLGLSVSRSLLEANGGVMEIESVDGRGARFTVRLPPAGSGPG